MASHSFHVAWLTPETGALNPTIPTESSQANPAGIQLSVIAFKTLDSRVSYLYSAIDFWIRPKNDFKMAEGKPADTIEEAVSDGEAPKEAQSISRIRANSSIMQLKKILGKGSPDVRGRVVAQCGSSVGHNEGTATDEVSGECLLTHVSM